MLKVLIADDEPKIRRGLKSLIDRGALDMEVIAEAEDGEMALELAQKTIPDILLVDICMPFLNGLQLIEQLNCVLKDVSSLLLLDMMNFLMPKRRYNCKYLIIY